MKPRKKTDNVAYGGSAGQKRRKSWMIQLVEYLFLRLFSGNTLVGSMSIDRFRWNACPIAKVSEIRTGASAAHRSEEKEGGVQIVHLESVQS